MARLLLPLLAMSLVCGCGTMLNLKKEPVMGASHVPYGGAIFDGAAGGVVLFNAVDPRNGFDGESCLNRCYCLGLGTYLMFVDLPLSLVGDTVTLPYVLYTGPKLQNIMSTEEGATKEKSPERAPPAEALTIKPATTRDLLAPKPGAKAPLAALEHTPGSGFASDRHKR